MKQPSLGNRIIDNRFTWNFTDICNKGVLMYKKWWEKKNKEICGQINRFWTNIRYLPPVIRATCDDTDFLLSSWLSGLDLPTHPSIVFSIVKKMSFRYIVGHIINHITIVSSTSQKTCQCKLDSLFLIDI